MSQDTKGPISWMAHNSVAANLVMLLCIIGGFFALQHAKQEVFPEIELDAVQVSVAYPGASPEEVEKGIVKPVEEAIRGLEGVKEIKSTAGEGSGSVRVELVEGENLQKLANDIRTEVERIRTFPADAEEPQVKIVARKREVIDMVVYGNVDRRALHYYGELVRDAMVSDSQITQVEVSGLPPMEIAIHVPQATLRRYNLTMDEIARRVRGASLELPFGGIKSSNGEILLRMIERRDYGTQFAKIPIITNTDGSEVLLEELATIKDGFEESDYLATFEGKPAVMLEIFRVGKQTPIDISEAVKRQMEQVQNKLPKSVKMAILRDRSTIYSQRINLLLRNAALGLLLVLFSLGLFLELRLAFWVMMGIPISFLGSLLILPFTGASLNMISLFAYIVSLGIVVDDAIIVGEKIYQKREEGLPYLQAATEGAREIATPITFSILTNIATFMPLYVMPGRMGKFFWQIPMVVVTVFIISLLESLFVLPAHLGHQKENKNPGLVYRAQQRFSRGFKWAVNNLYGPMMQKILFFRYIALTVAICGLMLVLSWAISGRMGFQSFPRIESDRSTVDVVMPYGTTIDKSTLITNRLVQAAIKTRDKIKHHFVNGIFAEIGRNGSHTMRVRVYLVGAVQREKIGISTAEFTKKWRKEAGPILGAEYARFAANSGGPGGGRAALTIQLEHSNTQILKNASEELAIALNKLEYTQDVDDGYQQGKQQLDFTVLPEGKALGITSAQLGRQLRHFYHGAEVVRQLRGRNEIKIKVRLPKKERVSEYNLDEMVISTPTGKEVMLREIAFWKRGYAYTAISRNDGRRVVQVTANAEPRSKVLEVLTKVKAEVLPRLLETYPGLSYSFQGRQADQRESIESLLRTSLIAFLVVYGLLAVPFRSYLQPLIIMFSIPFGFVGAILGHWLMGYTLCIPSILGIIALSGVVINDSLVLVDGVNQLRKKRDTNISQTLIEGAILRFRPIMLTTLTTFCGLLPMIFETSRQAKFLIPMAVSLGFGIVFSTLITLVIVPCFYLAIEDCRQIGRKIAKFLNF